MVEGREGGRDEEGADGTVFFAAKWQRARAESEHLPLLPRRRAQENHRLLSSPKQKAHPPADTDRQSVAARRGAARLSRAQFLISYLSLAPRPLPPTAVSSSSRYIRFLYPPVGTVRVLQDFQFWQMARAEQKDQFPPLSSHLLRRSFVESRPMKLLARDKLVNSKRSSLISLKRNGTLHDRHGTKRSFLSIRI